MPNHILNVLNSRLPGPWRKCELFYGKKPGEAASNTPGTRNKFPASRCLIRPRSSHNSTTRRSTQLPQVLHSREPNHTTRVPYNYRLTITADTAQNGGMTNQKISAGKIPDTHHALFRYQVTVRCSPTSSVTRGFHPSCVFIFVIFIA